MRAVKIDFLHEIAVEIECTSRMQHLKGLDL